MSDEEDNTTRIETQAQYSDFERVGIPGFIDIEYYIDTLGKRNKLFMSAIEKFVKSVFYISKELAENGLIKSNEIKTILDNISNLSKPSHKNAAAYVIGYLVSDGGNQHLTFKILSEYLNNKIIKNYMEDENIDCSAIIRYARLWTNII